MLAARTGGHDGADVADTVVYIRHDITEGCRHPSRTRPQIVRVNLQRSMAKQQTSETCQSLS